MLKRCYSAATVCAPSRAALLTGKYTIHSGVRRNDQDLPAEEVTIAEALRSHGYATALFGKWHHGNPRGDRKDFVHPMDQGFEEFFGYTDAVKAWEKFPKTLWDGHTEVAVSGYFDDLITDRAIAFLGQRREKPFFLGNRLYRQPFPDRCAGGGSCEVPRQVPGIRPEPSRSGHLRGHGEPTRRRISAAWSTGSTSSDWRQIRSSSSAATTVRPSRKATRARAGAWIAIGRFVVRSEHSGKEGSACRDWRGGLGEFPRVQSARRTPT